MNNDRVRHGARDSAILSLNPKNLLQFQGSLRHIASIAI
jgi:hypothetical protein